MSSQATGDPGNARWGPHNTVTVVDPSPVNWLSITWNTMEEANRVDHEGMGQPSLAAGWRWVDDETLELPPGGFVVRPTPRRPTRRKTAPVTSAAPTTCLWTVQR